MAQSTSPRPATETPGAALAPPTRDSMEDVFAQYEAFVGTHCRAFFDTLPTVILVLNCRHQVVFANNAAVNYLGQAMVEDVLGQRPGEALGCINAEVGPGGCGTSRHCRNCGAVRAILAAVRGSEAKGECTLLRRGEFLEGLDLHVSATPLAVDGAEFVILALTDISHQMRRRNIERIFFHDVLNLAGGINGLVELLRTTCAAEQSGEFGVLQTATQTLVDEIVAQRELLAAESHELQPVYAEADGCELLRQLAGLYASTPLAQNQTITVLEPCAPVKLETDVRLAQRVLGNMLKNALEAGKGGDTVSLSCLEQGDMVRLAVHNAAVIPQDRQDDIFHRRFSTKGDSRGLGTYSMMLLAERYLHGSVDFESTPFTGTTFFLLLPKRLKKA